MFRYLIVLQNHIGLCRKSVAPTCLTRVRWTKFFSRRMCSTRRYNSSLWKSIINNRVPCITCFQRILVKSVYLLYHDFIQVAVLTVAGAFRKGKSFFLSNCVRYLQCKNSEHFSVFAALCFALVGILKACVTLCFRKGFWIHNVFYGHRAMRICPWMIQRLEYTQKMLRLVLAVKSMRSEFRNYVIR